MKIIRKNMRVPSLLVMLSVLAVSMAMTGCGQKTGGGNSGDNSGNSALQNTELQSESPQMTATDAGNTPDRKSDESQTLSEQSDIIVFRDSLGREVTVSERPQRVAAMIGSFADIWCLAGGKDSLVASAHDTWTYFDLGLDESVADIGNTKEPNLEILAASQPDFVIASSNTEADIKVLDTLETMGMNVAYFQVSNFEEYLDMLDICTRITGDRERYHRYGELLQDQIDRSKAAADGSAPTVLYVRASASSCKVKNSRGSVLGEMLSDLGGVNIADSENSLLEDLNMEVIVAEDPQFIFLILQGADKDAVMETLEKDLLSHPAWQSLTAVQERRFYILDDTLYNLKPNARWGEAYEQLARILYPDSF